MMIGRDKPKRMSLLLAASLLGLTATAASAQDSNAGRDAASAAQAPVAGDTTAAADKVDDIVVTARKKSETLLDVPIAVSAFSAARIEDHMANSITDLAAFTPGLQIEESFGRSGDRPVIRGASNIQFTDGKVGIFLNGAPYFGDFSSLELANVERVEVIKGPQSAVFGRGTLSGAINVVLKRPGDRFEGRVSGTAGSYDRRELSAFVSGPITSWLGVEAGVKFFDVDGQYRNQLFPRERLGDQNTHQYMAGLFLDPSSDLSASLMWLHQRDNDGLYAIGLQPSTADNCYLTTRPYYCGTVHAPETYALNSNELQRPGLYRNADRFIGDLDWNVGGSGYHFTAQAGYSDLLEVTGTDQSFDGRDFYLLGSPFVCENYVPIGNQLCTQSGFNTTDGIHRKTETYEARISSPSSDRLRWRLGVYAGHDKRHGLKKYLEASELGLDLLPDIAQVNNRAVFGGVDFDVTPKLTLTGELRYQVDKVRNTTPSYRAGDVFSDAYLSQLTLPDPDQIIGVAGTRKATFKATLPRVTANWKVDRGLSLYAQYSQGNAPGGFNPIGAPISVVKEEKLINYEIGAKTTRWGFDYLNLSAFWQDYKNQVLTNTYQTETAINSYNVNIGRTRIRGIELEGAYPLIGHALQLQFNYTLLDAEIRRGLDPEQAILLLGTACKTGTTTNLDLPGCRDAASVAGNRPPLVSKHMGSIGLRGEQGVGDGWKIFAGVDVVYRSKYYAQVFNLADSGDSTRVNVQIGLEDSHGLKITAWGKNINNDTSPLGILRYVDLGAGVAKAPSGDSSRAFAITPARKAEYGVTITKSF